MTPHTKPIKKEKEKMSAREFREKYGSKAISKPKSKGQKFKQKLSPQKRFYSSTAWIWFSRYIKIRESDSNGVVRCATSGKMMLLGDKNLHAGHCVKVFDGNNTNMNVAFDERNVLPQSSVENRYFSGRSEVMRDRIDQKFGNGTYEDLLIKSKQFKKYTDSELKDIADKYRLKVYELLEVKGLKKWW